LRRAANPPQAEITLAAALKLVADRLAARSTYGVADTPGYTPDPALVERIRKLNGGRLAPAPMTSLRWYPADVETALRCADAGDLSMLCRLWSSSLTDGVIRGSLSTRTGGVVRLPKIFSGPSEQTAELAAGGDTIRSVFDEMFPPSELELFSSDAIGPGVAVGEFLPVAGRYFPVFCRLPPEFLRYDRTSNAWLYRSIAGDLPITPGDGRWVFFSAGRVDPWRNGIAASVGSAWIDKLHAKAGTHNWESKLANPALVAVSPKGAVDTARQGWFAAAASWGYNTVIEAETGYDIKVVETNGRGYESFQKTRADSEREAVVAITGQEVTTTGAAAFQSTSLFEAIASDLIQVTADSLAYCLNTQGLPLWQYLRYGESALFGPPVTVKWDTTPPRDRAAMADVATKAGSALKALDEAAARHGKRVAFASFQAQIGIEFEDLPAQNNSTKLNLAPTDLAKAVRVDEARGSEGLPPIGDERGQLTISELDASAADTDASADATQAQPEVQIDPA